MSNLIVIVVLLLIVAWAVKESAKIPKSLCS